MLGINGSFVCVCVFYFLRDDDFYNWRDPWDKSSFYRLPGQLSSQAHRGRMAPTPACWLRLALSAGHSREVGQQIWKLRP